MGVGVFVRARVCLLVLSRDLLALLYRKCVKSNCDSNHVRNRFLFLPAGVCVTHLKRELLSGNRERASLPQKNLRYHFRLVAPAVERLLTAEGSI